MGFLQDRAKKAVLKGFDSIDNERLVDVIVLLAVARKIPISKIISEYELQSAQREKELTGKSLQNRITEAKTE